MQEFLAQSPSSPIWLPYLSLTFLIGSLVLLAQGRPLRRLFPENATSLRADVIMWLTGRGTITLSQWVVPVLAADFYVGNLGDPEGAQPGAVAFGVFMVFQFLFADFSFWAMHWVRHRIPLFWTLHIVHHSAEELNPLTAYRRHPLEAIVVDWLFRFFQGAPALVLVWLYPGVAFDRLLLITLIYVAFAATVANFQHMHVWISYGRTLEHLFISPAQHQIHHSQAPGHENTNYGQVLAIWDWAAGTLVTADAVDPDTMRVGVTGVVHNTVGEMFLHPLAEAYRTLTGRAALPKAEADGAEGSALS